MDNIDGKLTAAGFRNDRLQAGLALPVDDRRRYCRVEASPVVALNHAVAVGMRDGPEAGLAAVEAVLGRGSLDGYHLAHAARADMQRRLGLVEAARVSYRRALEMTRQPAERRFIEARLAQLSNERATIVD